MNSKRILLTKDSDNSREISAIFRYCLIAGIFALGGAFRLNHINQPLVDIFSFRETSTAMMAENFSCGNWNIFLPQVNWAGPGPSYTGREFQTFTYLVGIIWAAVGQHDWIGRAVATAFGLVSLTFLYLLVRRIWGESYALGSAAIYAILPGAVVIDRSFLPDSTMLGLVLSSLWCYVVFLQTRRPVYFYCAMAVGVLGILTKLPGAVIVAPMVYATRDLLGKGEHRHKLLLRIGVVASISLVAVIAYYAWALHVAKTYPPFHLAGVGNFIWSARNESWFSLRYFFPEAVSVLTRWLWTWPGIILALIGLIESFSVARFSVRESESHYTPWLFHWWLAGCLVLYIVAAYELVWNPWNFHVFNVVAAAFAGRALIWIGRIPWFGKSQSMTLLKISIPLIVLTYSSIGALQFFWRLRPRSVDDYELGKALCRISQPGDLVATIPSEMGDPRVIYYSHRHGWVFPDPYRDWSMLSPDDDTSIQALEELRLQKTRWLGIARFPFDRHQPPRNFWKYHRKLTEYMERTCERTGSDAHGTIYRILTPEELRNKGANLTYLDRTR